MQKSQSKKVHLLILLYSMVHTVQYSTYSTTVLKMSHSKHILPYFWHTISKGSLAHLLYSSRGTSPPLASNCFDKYYYCSMAIEATFLPDIFLPPPPFSCGEGKRGGGRWNKKTPSPLLLPLSISSWPVLPPILSSDRDKMAVWAILHYLKNFVQYIL